MNLRRLITEYMIGRACLAECLEFDRSAKMQVHVVPRKGDVEAGRRVFSVDPHFVFHHGNAFEAADGRIVVDSVAWRRVDFSFSLDTLDPSFYGAGAGSDGGLRSELYRYTLDMKTGAPAPGSRGPDMPRGPRTCRQTPPGAFPCFSSAPHRAPAPRSGLPQARRRGPSSPSGPGSSPP